MHDSENPNKLQFRIDVVLTVLFLAAILFMGAMTLTANFDGIRLAITSKTRLEGYLGGAKWEEAGALDQVEARVRSLDNHLAANVYGGENLGYLNSSFQYGLGKDLVVTGPSQMLTTTSGHLFDLQNYVSMDTSAANLQAMRDIVPADIPFLFVYEHPSIYSEDQIPAGYDPLDHSDDIADEVVEKIGSLDFPMLDSRDVFAQSGLTLEEFLYRTDQHWATRASIAMAQAVAEKLTEMTGVDLHPEKLDIDQFETETYPELFLGKYGQRIGTGNVAPDDVTIYWPKYPTNITRHTNYLGDVTEITGEFRDSVIRWKYLDRDVDGAYNVKAYFDYGLTENYDIYTNPDGAPCTLLVLKDSYSASICSFLSLVADEIYAVDLRKDQRTLAEWIEMCDPDAVIVSYSMQMLRNDEYEFQ